jgi:muramoyltetrapeptide carboxypeptidase LdcA involved in peptidoglycan recycling
MNEKHFEIIRENPKIFMGMSDTTVNHFMCYKAGLSSFYSPANMYGYAENGGIPDLMIKNTKNTLFSDNPIGKLPSAEEFIIDRIEWDKESNNIRRKKIKSKPWRFIQGIRPAQGRLLGGCSEVLDIINGTSLWPEPNEWKDAILFMENSEEMLSPQFILCLLRNFGAQGILGRINGILFARPGGEFKPSEQNKSKNGLRDTAGLTMLS